MKKRLTFGIVALVLLAGAGAVAFQLSRPPAPPPAEPAAPAEDTAAVLSVAAKVTPLRSAMRISAFGESKQGDIIYTMAIVPDRQDPRLRWNMTASASIRP